MRDIAVTLVRVLIPTANDVVDDMVLDVKDKILIPVSQFASFLSTIDFISVVPSATDTGPNLGEINQLTTLPGD